MIRMRKAFGSIVNHKLQWRVSFFQVLKTKATIWKSGGISTGEGTSIMQPSSSAHIWPLRPPTGLIMGKEKIILWTSLIEANEVQTLHLPLFISTTTVMESQSGSWSSSIALASKSLSTSSITAYVCCMTDLASLPPACVQRWCQV